MVAVAAATRRFDLATLAGLTLIFAAETVVTIARIPFGSLLTLVYLCLVVWVVGLAVAAVAGWSLVVLATAAVRAVRAVRAGRSRETWGHTPGPPPGTATGGGWSSRSGRYSGPSGPWPLPAPSPRPRGT